MDIHIGASTHIHFQAITPQSFNTMNTRVRRPLNPIPPLTLTCSAIFSYRLGLFDLGTGLEGGTFIGAGLT